MKIQLFNVGFHYSEGTPFEKRALQNVDMKFTDHKFYAVIGHTGSGKSTVMQMLNALLKPTEGHLVTDGLTITKDTKQKQLSPIRKKVGMVFQFAEQQLFEETVMKDIIFGPLNFGISRKDAEARARELMQELNMDAGLLERSPFELSGGQMRRVAIAGVLAANPDVIVLDEPTAGLDPRGQEEIMQLFHYIGKKRDVTIILVTHQMEQAARADEIYVMHEGKTVMHGTPQQVFSHDLKQYGIMPPDVVKLQLDVEKKYNDQFNGLAVTPEAFHTLYHEWRGHYAR